MWRRPRRRPRQAPELPRLLQQRRAPGLHRDRPGLGAHASSADASGGAVPPHVAARHAAAAAAGGWCDNPDGAARYRAARGDQ